MEEAIKKIKEEMEKNKNDVFITEVGVYVLLQVEINKNAAKEIANGEKTIVGALNTMQKEAKKKANGKTGCVIMSDSEGFGIINKYFGFEAIQNKLEVVKEPVKEVKEKKENVIEVDFDINLDDLF